MTKSNQISSHFDKVIIGAGFYGLYSALLCGKQGQRILVMERDREPLSRASYINQARIHMGYHYPRSISTAIKSAGYFERFCEEFDFCINRSFNQIYAISSRFSWTGAADFQQFCNNANIPCYSVEVNHYFRPGMCDGAFLTKEYTYDAQILRTRMMEDLTKLTNVKIMHNCSPKKITRLKDVWRVTASGVEAESPFILNSTYASVNDVLKITDGGVIPFKIKYEKCEIILCTVNEQLKNTGITVMDGPFFSLMPFGKTGLHSLTSVMFTPHETSYETEATFSCQVSSGERCTPGNLYNCNECMVRPPSAWVYMNQLVRKYLREEYDFNYQSSLFSIKPVLIDSEVDDSRPTVIRKHFTNPTMVSVLSGKINTVYDLDEVLLNG